MRIAHLSRIRGPADGGISPIVQDLLAAQNQLLSPPGSGDSLRWLAAPDDLAFGLRQYGPDLVHVHGLWSVANRLIARTPALPAVIAPQGMLDAWALRQSRWRKRLAWRLFERGNLQRAAAVQALGPSELASIRSLGIRAPVALIPNAVSPPEPLSSSLASACPSAWPCSAKRVLLFLSRFHAKKGLDPLLKAWQSVAESARRHHWQLVLVGYGDEGALARQVAAAQARSELADATVLGPCFGLEKQACFRAASAFILPSFSEGLPMAALEAMSHRLPCLLSHACNLPEAFTAGAALPADPGDLTVALERLFALSDAERAAMGTAGLALVQECFSWPQVARQTLELYRWILDGGARPGFVEL